VSKAKYFGTERPLVTKLLATAPLVILKMLLVATFETYRLPLVSKAKPHGVLSPVPRNVLTIPPLVIL
jgi:hypothetical protein